MEKKIWEEARQKFDDKLQELLGQSEYSKYVGSFHRQALKRFVSELAVEAYNQGKAEERTKLRSTTFQGIADAMAEQWGASPPYKH
jgi:gamma-glutamyl-gamma-aminobutyrate hydrolase PuuD